MTFGGDYRTKINMALDGFKTHEERESNYFSGGVSISHYFVKSKNKIKKCILNTLKDYEPHY
jgi:hypothetical protein